MTVVCAILRKHGKKSGKIVTPTFKCSLSEVTFIFRDTTATSDGKIKLSSTLKLCNNLTSTEDVTRLTDWLNDVYSNLAMVNYPYPANFLASLPAYPVREFCSRMGKSGKPVLDLLSDALSLYTNYTGQIKCININSSTNDFGEYLWNYQVIAFLTMYVFIYTRFRF